MKRIRIGGGAGYAGDRIEPAVELARYGDLDYLIFECLAERTIALAQAAKIKNPSSGYDPMLEDRLEQVLPDCAARGIRIVTNMGAANPEAGARKAAEVANRLGISDLKIASVSGDDVLGIVREGDYQLIDSEMPLNTLCDSMVSANAYLGVEGIVEALGNGADIIITGRVADPALVLGPLIHEFGWSLDDWSILGKGTLAGHLLECAGQITGGYFADPGYKDVPNLANLGFPIAEVFEDGAFTLTKLERSGGLVNVATCKEQLIYEIHNPQEYVTPDVIADFSSVVFEEISNNCVRVTGADGKLRPSNLKVSIGYLDGHMGEGQISYAGPGAVARAQLAREIIASRFETIGLKFKDIRYDFIGINSVHGDLSKRQPITEPYEVRLRVVAHTETANEAARVGAEVEALLTCGPAGGGGATRLSRPILAIQSLLLPRKLVRTHVRYVEVKT